MYDTQEVRSGLKGKSMLRNKKNAVKDKRHVLRNSILICVLLLAVIAVNTAVINFTCRYMYLKRVSREAEHLTEYIRQQMLSYQSIEWLLNYWSEAELYQPDDTEMDAYYALNPKMRTADEIAEWEPDMQEMFAVCSYYAMTNAVEDIFRQFECSALYVETWKKDRADSGYIFYFEDDLTDISINTAGWLSAGYLDLDSVYQLYGDEIRSGNGSLRTMSFDDETDDGKVRVRWLQFFLPALVTDDSVYMIEWYEDWTDVSHEIRSDALATSIFTTAMLVIIGLIVLLMYRKYAAQRIRIGMEREKTRADLDICQKIQSSQMPDPEAEFRGEAIDVSVFVRPAKEVGGDFCDCFMIGDHKAGLVIADVSDKGISAAMFMMAAKSMIRNEMKKGASPAEIMKNVNEQLAGRNKARMFVTVWLAVIDLITGECTAVNAGHENPVLRRAGGSWEMQEYPHDMPAALFSGAVYNERTVQLYEGDMIFVYTDGVTDTVNTRDEQFGESRITEALNADSCGQTKAVIDGLLAQIDVFSEGAEQFDDIGMVCFRYHVRKSENGENKK